MPPCESSLRELISRVTSGCAYFGRDDGSPPFERCSLCLLASFRATFAKHVAAFAASRHTMMQCAARRHWAPPGHIHAARCFRRARGALLSAFSQFISRPGTPPIFLIRRDISREAGRAANSYYILAFFSSASLRTRIEMRARCPLISPPPRHDDFRI